MRRLFSASPGAAPKAVRLLPFIGLGAGVLWLALNAGSAVLAERIIRPRLVQQAEHATGRRVHIGPVTLGLVPLRLTAGQVGVSNPPGFTQADMLAVDTARADLAFWPLLAGRVVVQTLTLHGATLALERHEDRANWRFQPDHASSGQRNAAARPDAVPAVAHNDGEARFPFRQLEIDGARISWNGQVFTPDRLALNLDDARHVQMDADLRWNGFGTHTHADLGAAESWRTDNPLSFRITTGLGGANTIDLQGTVDRPHALAGMHGQLSAQFDATELPMPGNTALHASFSDQDGGGLLHGVVFSDVHLSSQAADAAGTIGLRLEGRPAIHAVLASQHLAPQMLAALGRRLMPHATAPAGPPVLPVPGGAGAGNVPPGKPETWPWLRAMDADVQWSAETLQWGDTAYHDARAHLLLQEGRLRVDPLSAQSPAGFIAGGVVVDGTRTPQNMAVVLRASDLALAGVLGWFGLTPAAEGQVALDIELQAAGTAPDTQLASMTGHIAAWSTGGTLGGAAMQQLSTLLTAAAKLPPFYTVSTDTTLRCLALRMDAAHGQADIPALLVDTDDLRLGGSGTIDLPQHALDLELRPAANLRVGPVSLALQLGGTWDAPRMRLKQSAHGKLPGGPMMNQLEQFMAMLPRGTAPADRCATALAAVQAGLHGPDLSGPSRSEQ